MTPIRDDPIVVIHGINGSVLAQTYDDSFDVIWSALQKRFESISDLELDDQGEADKDPRDLIAVQRLEQLAYGELLGRLRRHFPRVPVYIFRYDWRKDLRRSALELDRFLATVEHKTGRKSSRVVAHSMGALVLVALLGLDPERNLRRVGRTVFAAPVFRGTIDAIRGLVVGEATRFGIQSSEAFRKIARSFPSIYQLVASYPGHWDHPKANANIWDIEDWQRPLRVPAWKRDREREKRALMGRHLDRARAFHANDLLDMNGLAKRERDKFLVLYGKGEETRIKLKVKAQNSTGQVRYFFDFEAKSVWGDGDGTVPAVSAEHYARLPHLAVDVSRYSAWWQHLWDDKAKRAVAGFHAMFTALDKVQGLIIDWLEGKQPKPSWANIIAP